MAEKAQHTPGPWHYNQELSLHTRQLVYGSDKYLVADAGGIYRRTEEEAVANARLIAAAPDLLALAEALLGFEIGTPKDYATKGPAAFTPLNRHIIELQNQARSAIAKATGGN